MKIGIIGGTGIYSPEIVSGAKEVDIQTPYGQHSDMIEGKMAGVDVVMCFRHNRDHSLPPHMVNYKANIFALKELGVSRIIAIYATGSLKEELKPGDFVIPDQLIDFGKEVSTHYEGPDVYHISMADPFCPELRQILIDSAKKFGVKHHPSGTYIRIAGPRFSTRAESKMYRQFADVIGMTGAPEAVLAREKALCFAMLATVTDYDVWAEKPVSHEEVRDAMAMSLTNTNKIVIEAVTRIGKPKCKCEKALEGAKA